MTKCRKKISRQKNKNGNLLDQAQDSQFLRYYQSNTCFVFVMIIVDYILTFLIIPIHLMLSRFYFSYFYFCTCSVLSLSAWLTSYFLSPSFLNSYEILSSSCYSYICYLLFSYSWASRSWSVCYFLRSL